MTDHGLSTDHHPAFCTSTGTNVVREHHPSKEASKEGQNRGMLVDGMGSYAKNEDEDEGASDPFVQPPCSSQCLG
eukprot:CAMPEP_0198130826 /NCGR_PEP_ID=MMETSP1442-20131203/54796_1 /TAXON_ID= /ORGANISM="Craspedostauros australis, Strain CCMP3328" /LENGTH=74 /DNA_ID=CAMNT_0043791523 /DNA_START=1 /DNA_END=225 /DNA_ORIENTATION=-